MISFTQAVGWLDEETRSKITPLNRGAIQQLRSAPPPGAARAAQQLTEYLSGNLPPDDAAEVNIYLGIYYFERGSFGQAAGCMENAAELLAGDDHRLALVNCMLFHINCAANVDYPVEWWRRAIRGFIQKACAYHLLQGRETEQSICDQLGETEKRYKNRAVETAYEVVKEVSGSFQCLFEFHGSCCTNVARTPSDRILAQIPRGQFDEAVREIALLKGITERSIDHREAGEAFAIAGMLYSYKGLPAQAVKEFRSALAYFQPADHEVIFIRWMMGLQQLNQPAQCDQAFRNLERSISTASEMAKEASHQNNLYKQYWYEAYQMAMNKYLSDMIDRKGTAGGFDPDPKAHKKRSGRSNNFTGFPGIS